MAWNEWLVHNCNFIFFLFLILPPLFVEICLSSLDPSALYSHSLSLIVVHFLDLSIDIRII